MHAAVDVLFQPFSCKALRLPNRVVMAPMTRGFSPNGVPGDNVAAYYRRRAEGGVGLILSEGTLIDRPGAGNRPDVPKFYGREPLAGWKAVIDGVHEAGGKMGPQIWHVGAMPDPRVDWEPAGGLESPSGIFGPRMARGYALSDAAISDCIESYGRAAADAKRLGFDTVEIHGAHGYLIDQFFWDKTNLRDGAYGGATLAERSRFAVEVVRAIRRALGEDIPIIFRLSQWKQVDYTTQLASTPGEMESWLCLLVEAGVDILHCSQRRFWQAEFPDIDGPNGLNCAGWAKKLTGAATISVGSVGLSGDATAAYAGESSTPADLSSLVERMERGEFDLIAVGRALLADPEWALKIQTVDHNSLIGFSPEAFGALY